MEGQAASRLRLPGLLNRRRRMSQVDTTGRRASVVISIDRNHRGARSLYLLHLKCPWKRIVIYWRSLKVRRGHLRLLYDDNEFAANNGSFLKVAAANGIKQLSKNVYAVVGSGFHTLAVEFTASDTLMPGQFAIAELRGLRFMGPKGFLADYTRCEDKKACLEQMEPWSAIRGSNEIQLACLSINVEDEEKRIDGCSRWRECLRKAGASGGALRAMLSAALQNGSGSSDVPGAQIDAPRSNYAEGDCLNPETEDPESWYCNCYENMKQRCSLLPQTLQFTADQCLQAQYCSSDRVCEGWKIGRCGDPAIVSLMYSLSNASSRSAVSASLVSRSMAYKRPAATLVEDGTLDGATNSDFDETLSIKQCT